MVDVAIIGAGIVGAAIARKLAHYELSICVLEKEADVACGSTKANSAIVHGGYAESHDMLKGRLCYQGRRQFAQLDSDLHFGFDPIGSFVLAFSEEERQGLVDLLVNGEKNGCPDLSILERDEILAMEPHISRDVLAALYCEGAGVCSPYEMCIALMENAIHNGCELKLNSAVSAIEKSEVGYTISYQQLVDGQVNECQLDARVVINAAGLFSDAIAQMVGIDSFTIEPRSGQYILFARGSGKKVKHVLFQMPSKMGKGILVTPTYHGNLLLGPDAVDDDGIVLATDLERLKHIYIEAQKTVPELDPKLFIRSFAGTRACASTHDFIIEEAKGLPGFILAAGIQSPGVTSSPAIADMVAELVGKRLELREKNDFDPNRRAIIERKELMNPVDAQRLVELPEGDPERLVCRCEQVSEATIIDALTREIPVTTIDGVKRRTRAGMGYCQGGFCRARVAELMSRVQGRVVDPAFDVEHSGINRVGKHEFLEFLKEEEAKR